MNETMQRVAYGAGLAVVLGSALAVGKASPGLAMTVAPAALAALNAAVRKWRGGELSRNEIAAQALPGTGSGGLFWYLTAAG